MYNVQNMREFGLSGTGAGVPAGSVLDYGAEFSVSQLIFSSRNQIELALPKAVMASGRFQLVTAQKLAGYVNPYYSIRVVTSQDFNNEAEVATTIQAALNAQGWRPTKAGIRINQLAQQSILTTPSGKRVQQKPSGSYAPAQDWGDPVDTSGFTDKLGLGLGLSTPIVIGAAILLAVVILKR